jgi:mannose-6-phosphate isomerase-like protein (cupin superfamily)
MHRQSFRRVPIIAVLLFGIMFSVLSPLARAKDATPPADPMAGVTVESLGSGLPAPSPGYTLVLLRITMAPGALIPRHVHPGQVILYVESGTFGTTFGEGDAMITRAAAPGTPVAAEPVTPNVEITMQPGDSVSYSKVTTHIMHNLGDKPLVLLVSALLSSDQPGFIFMGQ